VGLEIGMRYEIIEEPGERGPWKVRTRGYMYSVQTADGAEMLAYHWHPVGQSTETRPHMHLGSVTLQPDLVITKKTHIPSGGRISLESVLRLCVRELGVAAARDDWEQLLADSEDLFKMWRTWQ
jgi:hypothetical protein